MNFQKIVKCPECKSDALVIEKHFKDKAYRVWLCNCNGIIMTFTAGEKK